MRKTNAKHYHPTTWVLGLERVRWWFKGLYPMILIANRRLYMARLNRQRIKEDRPHVGRAWDFNAIEADVEARGLPCPSKHGLILLADREERCYLIARLEKYNGKQEVLTLRLFLEDVTGVRTWTFLPEHTWPLILSTWRRLPRRPPWKRALRDYHHHRELLVPLLLAHGQHNL